MFKMSKEEKFEFDITNLKRDLAIENMVVTEDDVNLLKRYANHEITMPELINIVVKNATM